MHVRANQPENVIRATFNEKTQRVLFRAVFVVGRVFADNRRDAVDERAREFSLLVKKVNAREHRRMKRQVVIGIIILVGRDEAGEHRRQIKRDEDIQSEHRHAIAAQLHPDDLRRRPPARRRGERRFIDSRDHVGGYGQQRFDGLARRALDNDGRGGLFAADFFKCAAVGHG